MQSRIRSQINTCLFQFKERVRQIVCHPHNLPSEVKAHISRLKLSYFSNLAQFCKLGSRLLKILSQLAWITFCIVLGLDNEVPNFDSVMRVPSRAQSKASVSRSRSPITRQSISPMLPKQTLNMALTRSVLSKRNHYLPAPPKPKQRVCVPKLPTQNLTCHDSEPVLTTERTLITDAEFHLQEECFEGFYDPKSE